MSVETTYPKLIERRDSKTTFDRVRRCCINPPDVAVLDAKRNWLIGDEPTQNFAMDGLRVWWRAAIC